jgi:uncharacterized protein Smg (DUF494 family)
MNIYLSELSPKQLAELAKFLFTVPHLAYDVDGFERVIKCLVTIRGTTEAAKELKKAGFKNKDIENTFAIYDVYERILE